MSLSLKMETIDAHKKKLLTESKTISDKRLTPAERAERIRLEQIEDQENEEKSENEEEESSGDEVAERSDDEDGDHSDGGINYEDDYDVYNDDFGGED